MEKTYLEIENIADKIEKLRIELRQNKKHQKLQGEEDVQYIDKKLFHIEYQLRELFEYCMLEITD